MEAFVLPAELLEQGDGPGPVLFLLASPSGLLACARVGYVCSSSWPRWPANGNTIVLSYSASLEYLVHSP